MLLAATLKWEREDRTSQGKKCLIPVDAKKNEERDVVLNGIPSISLLVPPPPPPLFFRSLAFTVYLCVIAWFSYFCIRTCVVCESLVQLLCGSLVQLLLYTDTCCVWKLGLLLLYTGTCCVWKIGSVTSVYGHVLCVKAWFSYFCIRTRNLYYTTNVIIFF